MADDKTLEIAIVAQDLATAVIEALKKTLDTLPEKEKEVSSKMTLTDTLKKNWVGLSAAVAAAGIIINEAIDWAKIGAKALQTEEAFRSVTNSYAVNGDALLAKMKEVSAGTVEESDLMRVSMKALQQGLDPQQIVSLLEVARSSARTAGTDIITAFEGITNAVANQTTRALKLYGIVIDQNKALEDYALKLGVSKDALTEQQQSAALAAAAIAEGNRQMAAMGDISLTASEKIQQSNAQMQELKETVGKLIVGGMQGLTGVFYAGAGAVTDFASGVMKLTAAWYAANGNIEMSNKLMAESKIMGAAADNQYQKAEKAWGGMAMSAKEAAKAAEGLAKIKNDAAAAAANEAVMQKKYVDEYVALSKVEAASAEARATSEQASMDRKYKEGIVSQKEYFTFLEKQNSEHTARLIEEKQNQIMALQFDDPKNAAANLAKKKELEEQIVAIRIASAAKQTEVETKQKDDSKKISEEKFSNWKVLEDLKMQAIQSNNDLAAAKDAAAVRLGLLTQQQALENQLERDKQFYAEKISLTEKSIADINVQLKQEGLTKEERDKLTTNLAEAYQTRLALQNDFAIKTIEVEQKISEETTKAWQAPYQAKAASAAAAMNNDNKMLGDRLAAVQANEDAEIEITNIAIATGQMSFAEGQAAITKIQADASAKRQALIKADADAFIAGVGAMLNYANDLGNSLKNIFSGFKVQDFSEVRASFGNAASAITADIKSLTGEVDRFTTDEFSNIIKQVQGWGTETFKQLYLYGKNVTWQSGEQIKEWANQVKEYVGYVQSLFQSLKDQINSWKDELDSLKGNEMAILERWYDTEMQKLKDKYGEDLKNTKEYEEAMTLLKQIYAEKRKKILDQEQQDAANAQNNLNNILTGGSAQDSSKGGTGGALGYVPPSNGGPLMPPKVNVGAGIISSLTASIQSQMSQITNALEVSIPSGTFPKEISVNKNQNISLTFEPPQSLDPETSRRWMVDVFWPQFEDRIRLKGGKE